VPTLAIGKVLWIFRQRLCAARSTSAAGATSSTVSATVMKGPYIASALSTIGATNGTPTSKPKESATRRRSRLGPSCFTTLHPRPDARCERPACSCRRTSSAVVLRVPILDILRLVLSRVALGTVGVGAGEVDLVEDF